MSVKIILPAGIGANGLITSTNGSVIGTSTQLNLIPGANITLTGSNNTVNNRIDMTITGSGGGVTTPTHVQSNGVRSSGTPANLVLRFAVTSGDIILVYMGWGNGAATPSSVSDNLSTVYTKATESLVGTASGGHNSAIFVGAAGATGTCTITPTYPASAVFAGLYASHFMGNSLTTNVDVAASISGTVTPTLSVTTTVDNDLVWGGCDTDASANIPRPPSNWVNNKLVNGNDAGAIYSTILPKAGLIDGTINQEGTIVAIYSLAMVALKHA